MIKKYNNIKPLIKKIINNAINMFITYSKKNRKL